MTGHDRPEYPAKNSDGTSARHAFSNFPASWKTHPWQSNDDNVAVVTHCQIDARHPLWYSREFHDPLTLAVGMKPAGVGFGIEFVICSPIQDGTGIKSKTLLARDCNANLCQGERPEILAIAKVLSNCAHVAAGRLVTSKLQKSLAQVLTLKEKLCLQWVASGKTAWEIGHIMHIAEPTVVFHLKNLMAKLNVINRAQALAVAIRAGLID